MDKKCFFVCPIGKENSEVRNRSNKVLNHLIKPICEELNYNVIRSDKENENDRIDLRIIEHLKDNDLIIVDITDHNPNVFYELGYRSALNLPYILIAETDTLIPFDITTINTLFYDIRDLDKVDEFKKNLKERIENTPKRDMKSETTAAAPANLGAEKIAQSIDALVFFISRKFDIIDKKNNEILSVLNKANTDSSTIYFTQFLNSMILKGMEDPEKFQNFIAILNMIAKTKTDDETDQGAAIPTT